jgi:hypothetical protein
LELGELLQPLLRAHQCPPSPLGPVLFLERGEDLDVELPIHRPDDLRRDDDIAELG